MHFTYDERPYPDLSQGDVLKRTPAVESLLKEVHPHYAAERNRCFIVLTQSCDLVRRADRLPKARYITIAAVRPLRLVLQRELERYQEDPIERRLNICNKQFYFRMLQFVEKLLNNNAPDHFYLHRDPSVGFGEDQCAVLQLSIAIKAELHYSTLLEARTVRLRETFQHKLGYLVGNHYARVATEDWCPQHCTKEEFERFQKQPVEELAIWIDQATHTQVLRALKRLNRSVSEEDLRDAVARAKQEPQDKRTTMRESLARVLEGAGVPLDVRESICMRFLNEPSVKTVLR